MDFRTSFGVAGPTRQEQEAGALAELRDAEARAHGNWARLRAEARERLLGERRDVCAADAATLVDGAPGVCGARRAYEAAQRARIEATR